MSTSLALNEDQQILSNASREFLDKRAPLGRIRQYRDTGDPNGFSEALWKEVADLGWLGIALPEEFGGSGLGLAEQSIVLEAMGTCLAPEPVLSSALAGHAILAGGNKSLQERILPQLATGQHRTSLAIEEPDSGYDIRHEHVIATRQGSGWRLSGGKIRVLDGHAADSYVVSARLEGWDGLPSVALFIVNRTAAGLTVTPKHRVDHRLMANITLDDVIVDAAGAVSASGQGALVIEAVMDRAFVGLAAEMLGLMGEAFKRTVEYLKTRQQFQVPIGSFQALQHRAALCFIEIELARSTVLGAARAIDLGEHDASKLASVAKARCSETAILVTNEALQMHGGIGMTDACDIGFFLKRARAAAQTFGDAGWHRRRFASLSGY